MKCPICRKAVSRTEPLLPFCSERCKSIDLGNWATGKYVISTPLRPNDVEMETKPQTQRHDDFFARLDENPYVED
jgi:uncharacterized protein